MENQKSIMSHLQKGLLISGILIALSVILYIAGFNTDSWAQWIGYAVFIGGIIWSCIYFGKQNNDMVTFGNTFAHGFKVTAVITVIMIIFSVVFLQVFPDIKEKAMEISRQKIEEKGNMTDDQIETALNFTQKWFTLFLVAGALFGYAIMGAVASLIGAAITKKKPVNPMDQMSM